MKRVLAEACGGKGKAQYMSAVWTETPQQQKIAHEVARQLGKESVPILNAKPWYDAEDYHQKYIEKQRTGQGRRGWSGTL